MYSNSLRRCGPNVERTPQRELGCTNDLPEGSPYGPVGSPGSGPQQYAYRGGSLGPPDEPLGDQGCDYKLSYEENLQMGYECYRLPPLGRVQGSSACVHVHAFTSLHFTRSCLFIHRVPSTQLRLSTSPSPSTSDA